MNRLMRLLAVFGTVLFPTASPAPAAEPTAEDYIEFMKPLLGSWNSTDEQEGKTTTGTWTYRLAPNKKCFLMNSEDESGPNAQTVDHHPTSFASVVALPVWLTTARSYAVNLPAAGSRCPQKNLQYSPNTSQVLGAC